MRTKTEPQNTLCKIKVLHAGLVCKQFQAMQECVQRNTRLECMQKQWKGRKDVLCVCMWLHKDLLIELICSLTFHLLTLSYRSSLLFRSTISCFIWLRRPLTPSPRPPWPRDPYALHCMTFQPNDRATKQLALWGILVPQRTCVTQYLSAWMHSAAHVCALLHCIIPFRETAQALWKTEGEYFQASDREDISSPYSESFVPRMATILCLHTTLQTTPSFKLPFTSYCSHYQIKERRSELLSSLTWSAKSGVERG